MRRNWLSHEQLRELCLGVIEAEYPMAGLSHYARAPPNIDVAEAVFVNSHVGVKVWVEFPVGSVDVSVGPLVEGAFPQNANPWVASLSVLNCVPKGDLRGVLPAGHLAVLHHYFRMLRECCSSFVEAGDLDVWTLMKQRALESAEQAIKSVGKQWTPEMMRFYV